MANPEHLARLHEGVNAWNTWRDRNPDPDYEIDLSDADLSNASLCGADLSGTSLSHSNLNGTDLTVADLRHAKLNETNLRKARLDEARLWRAKLNGADLSAARMQAADLYAADLTATNLDGIDLRSAKLQEATLDRASATGVKLWETQRAGWSIKGIVCECAFWDEDAKVPTTYAPGEFEQLYSDQTCIELFYHGGVSTFELNTLPALLYHLASLHPDSNIRLKSIEETGGGAKISISVGDASTESAEKIKADALQVYHAQLALRDKETERLQIEKDYLERLFLGKLVPAMLSAGTPHNVFNAPVTGVVISSGESKVEFHQTINDNSALLALLEKMMDRRADLNLPASDAREFEAELHSTTTELQKQNPDKSVLSKSMGFIRKLATEAATRAAGKLGEQAVSADWQSWLHQLGHFVSHLN
ncbi:MAG: pentapeptide repeat-containing protein [Terracidiphilus sp.]